MLSTPKNAPAVAVPHSQTWHGSKLQPRSPKRLSLKNSFSPWGVKQPPSKTTGSSSTFDGNNGVCDGQPSPRHASMGAGGRESPTQEDPAHTQCPQLGSLPLSGHCTPFGKVRFSNSWTGSANTTSDYGVRLLGRFFQHILTFHDPVYTEQYFDCFSWLWKVPLSYILAL